jgi:hypothetical protein
MYRCGMQARWSQQALSADSNASLDAERFQLAVDIDELQDLLLHSSFEASGDSFRLHALRAFLDELARLLPLSTAIDDRRTELTRSCGELAPDVAALLGDIRSWLSKPDYVSSRAATAAVLRETCAAGRSR